MMRAFVRHFVLTAAVSATLWRPAAGEPTATTLLSIGDDVPGQGVVQDIRDVAVNDRGDWIIVTDTDRKDVFSGRFVLRNGAVAFAQGDPVNGPPGWTVQLIARAPQLNADNNIGWTFDVGTSVGSAVDRLYFNDNPILENTDACTAPQCPPNTRYATLAATRINDSSDLLVAAALNIVDVGTRHALVRLNLNASGAIESEQVLVMEGDVLNGPAAPIGEIALTDRDFDWNDQGVVGLIAEYAGSPPADNDVLFVNENPVITEGDRSPVDGLEYGGLSRVCVNNAGDWLLWCTLTDGFSFTPTIVRNGVVFAMVEEDFVTTDGAYEVKFMLLNTGDLTSDGEVFWIADLGTKLTLLLGDEIIVREDVTIVDGEVVTGLGEFAAVSTNGRYVLTTVQHGATTSAVLIDRRPCPADLASPANGSVDVRDLLVLLSNWAAAGAGADLAAPANIVDVFDLFVLLNAWGPCP